MIYDFSGELKNKKVIIAPLNWGLGHATRCIPIIQKAINLKAEVILASDGIALEYLVKIFPDLPSYTLPGYNVKYTYNSMIINGIIQLPSVLSAIRNETKVIQRIIDEEQVELVISDNRYGCYHNKVKSIFITHQLNLLHDNYIFKSIINYQNRRWLEKFNQIWVPDYEDGRLSGKLSKDNFIRKEVKYIGPQSIHNDHKSPIKYDLLFLLSGPEPQRTMFEKMLIANAILMTDKKIGFISGSNNSPLINFEMPSHITYYSTVYGKHLTSILNQSKLVICRSGYSSIMDLLQLNKKCILIPTPGQTEQLYLANLHSTNPQIRSCKQEELTYRLSGLIKDLEQVV